MREVVGFWAHMHLITQLSRDLGGASGWRMTLSSGSGRQQKVSANGVRSTSQIQSRSGMFEVSDFEHACPTNRTC